MLDVNMQTETEANSVDTMNKGPISLSFQINIVSYCVQEFKIYDKVGITERDNSICIN